MEFSTCFGRNDEQMGNEKDQRRCLLAGRAEKPKRVSNNILMHVPYVRFGDTSVYEYYR